MAAGRHRPDAVRRWSRLAGNPTVRPMPTGDASGPAPDSSARTDSTPMTRASAANATAICC
jgi:hypothetical protein